jgi:leucyl-tRNA synthetase
MAVPAHDERDYEFSIKYNLPIKEVIILLKKEKNQKSKIKNQNDNSKLKIQEAFVGDGILADSSKYSGLTSDKAREKMAAWLEENKIGRKKVNYKMRDWVFSRQRYWGEPIPIIHCEKCGTVAVPESDLPVRLPEVEKYEPTGTGESPLANISEWVDVKCPKCGGPAKRETNKMPQWA